MSRYINRTADEFIEEVLIAADIGGDDVDVARSVKAEADAYIQAHPELLKYTLSNGDSLPLHMARDWGYYGTARYLLEKGADVNYVNPKTKETILTYALRDRASPEFIEFLRNHPAVIAMTRARAAKGFFKLGRKGLGPKSTPDTEAVISSFLTGKTGSVEQQEAQLKKEATGKGGRRKTKKNKKQQKRRKTRK